MTNSIDKALSDVMKAAGWAASAGRLGSPQRNSAEHVHQLLPGLRVVAHIFLRHSLDQSEFQLFTMDAARQRLRVRCRGELERSLRAK
jgi:hypothetical protein